MISTMYKLMLCHFLGDYVFQTDFIAKTKGENWWHMLAHCVTYTAPFIYFFGFDLNIVALLSFVTLPSPTCDFVTLCGFDLLLICATALFHDVTSADVIVSITDLLL